MKENQPKSLFTELSAEASATVSGGQVPGYFYEWHCFFDSRPEFRFKRPNVRSFHHHERYYSDRFGPGVVIDQYSSFNIIID